MCKQLLSYLLILEIDTNKHVIYAYYKHKSIEDDILYPVIADSIIVYKCNRLLKINCAYT